MTGLKEKNKLENSREHLANERTFLAWIRTSIALMGFGFVIVKFSLFLKEISLIVVSDIDLSKEYSAIVGVVMIILGVVITVLAFFQFKKNEKQINNNINGSSGWLTLFITFIILIGGIVLIMYLFTII